MIEAVLNGTKLIDAILVDADLINAKLTKADLTRAKLTKAKLTGADLTGADLTETDLAGATLIDTIFDINQIRLLERKYDLEKVKVYIDEGKIINYHEYKKSFMIK